MDYRECLEILGLKNATSQKQVDTAYRNMVHTWNPDRFPFDAELRKHAEEKLRKINLAYEQLSAYLSSGHEQEKRAWLNRKPNAKSKPVERPETAGYHAKSPYAKSATQPKPGQPRQGPSGMPSASGPVRTSSAGRYMVIGLLLLLGGFTVFIINYLLKLDQSDFDNRAPTSSIMKKLSGESQSSESTKKSGSRKRELKKPGYSEKGKSDGGLSTRQGYYEIYLKGGGVIIAEKWWEQGNMIMYKTKFGTMGIEKDSVDNIVRK